MAKRITKEEVNVLDYKINSKYRTDKQKEFATTIKKNRITFCKGSAGTGKTFIALKTALELLKSTESNFNEIILIRPIMEVSDKSLGSLPGSYDDKISIYFEPLYDNIDKLIGKDNRILLRSTGYLKDKLVNFARGCTFGTYDTSGKPIGSIVIIDEVQNFTIHELTTLLTRLGEGSIIICLADLEQIDNKKITKGKDCITYAIDKLHDLEGIGIVEFADSDIVRDKFLIEIIKRFKQ